ncbi:hypothetical protein F4782DRAFT_480774 [Xylaria castorea]|nr:hypothetical protein F4782DRAFT_480774 [Xylaria castorea]
MPPSPSSTQHPPPNLNGVFRNQRWLCNCDPRLDAVVKVVTQNPKNHGKRFYSCPRYGKGNHCDMFLFTEDAQTRELECLMSNGRSEKRQTTLLESMTPSKGKQRMEDATALAEVDDPQVVDNVASTSKSATVSTSNLAPLPRSSINTSSTTRSSTLKDSNESTLPRPEGFYDTTSDEDEDEEENRSPTSRTVATTPANGPTGSKRKRSFEEEDLLDDLSSGGEEELVAVTESSSKTASTLSKQHNTFITPSATRTADMIQNGLPTPSLTKGKSVKKVLFKDEVAGESSTNGANTNAKRQRLEDSTTPTSHASRLFGTDAIIGPSSSPSPPLPSSTNLTSEVMGLLKNEDITPAVRSEVRRTLEKYVNQAKGYERGRDASRKAIKEVEDRTAVLRQKVDDLERSRQELRTQLMEIWGKV